MKPIGMNLLKSLREKCLNTEFFLVRIFPHSDWIRRDTSMRGNTDQKKTPYLDTFHAVSASRNSFQLLLVRLVDWKQSSYVYGVFTGQILKNSLPQKARPIIYFKTRDRIELNFWSLKRKPKAWPRVWKVPPCV